MSKYIDDEVEHDQYRTISMKKLTGSLDVSQIIKCVHIIIRLLTAITHHQ